MSGNHIQDKGFTRAAYILQNSEGLGAKKQENNAEIPTSEGPDKGCNSGQKSEIPIYICDRKRMVWYYRKRAKKKKEMKKLNEQISKRGKKKAPEKEKGG